MLVFLEPARFAAPRDGICTLPDGHTVCLRDAFPESGCYDIGSMTPLWTAPWEDYERWIVSDDLRFLVRLNCNAVDDGEVMPAIGKTSWAIKIYDRGRELGSYNLSDLIDYPLFLPLSWVSDYRYDWMDDYDGDLPPGKSTFDIRTTTREQYCFDLTTGEIIWHHHFWRQRMQMANIAITLITLGVVGLIWRLFRKRPPQPLSNDSCNRVGQFSLRTLLVIVTSVALLCGIGPRWPHIALLATSLIVALVLSRRTVRNWHANRSSHGGVLRTLMFASLLIATLFSWCAFYVLTATPVNRALLASDVPEDARLAVVMTAYRPLIWAHGYVPFELLRWYERAW